MYIEEGIRREQVDKAVEKYQISIKGAGSYEDEEDRQPVTMQMGSGGPSYEITGTEGLSKSTAKQIILTWYLINFLHII